MQVWSPHTSMESSCLAWYSAAVLISLDIIGWSLQPWSHRMLMAAHAVMFAGTQGKSDQALVCPNLSLAILASLVHSAAASLRRSGLAESAHMQTGSHFVCRSAAGCCSDYMQALPTCLLQD